MEKLFGTFNTPQILDDSGHYRGHVALSERYELKKKEFEEYFDSLPDQDLKDVVRKSFFEHFERSYYETQRNIAQKYLERKIVRVERGIVKANAKPESMNVYYVDRAYWFALQKDPDLLVELCYGEDSLGRILVRKILKLKSSGTLSR